MSDTKVVISGKELSTMFAEVTIAIKALTKLQAGWEGQFWLNKVGKPIWVWKYGIPVKASSLDIKETIQLYENQVGSGLSLAPTTLQLYERGRYWIDNDIRILKDTILLIEMASPEGELHLSGYDCRVLARALSLENTETRLKALI